MTKKKKYRVNPIPVYEKTKSATASRKRPTLKQTFSFPDHWLPMLIIFIVAIGLYFQVTKFDYVLDDTAMITSNKLTQQGIKGIGDIFSHESFYGYFGKQETLVEGDRYRPLSIA